MPSLFLGLFEFLSSTPQESILFVSKGGLSILGKLLASAYTMFVFIMRIVVRRLSSKWRPVRPEV